MSNIQTFQTLRDQNRAVAEEIAEQRRILAENKAIQSSLRIQELNRKQEERERKEREKQAEKERKELEKQAEREARKSEREAERERKEKVKQDEKKETFQSRLIAEYGKMQLMLNRPNYDLDLSFYNGLTIERIERYHGPSVAYVYYNWDALSEKRGRAYDHKSRSLLADQVYKAQFFKMIKELDTEEWPVVKRKVQYTQAGYKYGRYVVRNILGMQGISRPLRHTFSEGIYRDVDIKNAHPTLYKYLCEQLNLEHPCLTSYITHRDLWLKALMEVNPGTTKDYWKQILLARLNGGKKGKDLGDKVEIDGKFVEEFEETRAFVKELERNHAAIVEYFDSTPEYQHYRKSVEQAEKIHNLNGSIVNHWMCDMENRILCTLIMYLKEKGLQAEVLCFDGCMINVQDKKDLEKCTPELLQDLSDKISEKFGISLMFTYKKFDENIEIEEEELNKYTSQDPLWRCFNWRALDEQGGSDFNCASLLKTVFQDDIILTDVSKETKSLSFDLESKLWVSTTCFDIQNKICAELQQAVNKGIDYWPNRLKNSKDEIEYKVNESKANEWIQRKKDRTNWGNMSKSSSVFTALKPMLRKEDFGNRMNVSVPYEMPLLEGKVIDLRTGTVRERCQNDFYDFECPVIYQPWKEVAKEKRKIVNDFMFELFGKDKDIVRYMQVLTGYLMTKENTARSVYMVPGDGSNGKSFFFNNILGAILGKNYLSPDPRNMVGENESNFIGSFQLMSKASTVCLSELPTNSTLNETLLKRVSGDDGLTKERKHKEETVTIKFLCKLVVLFNWSNVPEVSADDQAFWDRVVCLYFPACFKHLTDSEKEARTKVYKDNLNAFFSYFVEGAIKFYTNKSELNNIPEKIRENTKKFRSLRDVVGRFIEERCDVEQDKDKIKTSDLTVGKEHLFNLYRLWGKSNQVFTTRQPMLGMYKFYAAIEAKGYDGERREGASSIRVFGGIRNKPCETDDTSNKVPLNNRGLYSDPLANTDDFDEEAAEFDAMRVASLNRSPTYGHFDNIDEATM